MDFFKHNWGTKVLTRSEPTYWASSQRWQLSLKSFHLTDSLFCVQYTRCWSSPLYFLFTTVLFWEFTESSAGCIHYLSVSPWLLAQLPLWCFEHDRHNCAWDPQGWLSWWSTPESLFHHLLENNLCCAQGERNQNVCETPGLCPLCE